MILELALLAIGYIQPSQYTPSQVIPPPAYIQKLSSLQNCESILARLKEGNLSNEERASLKHVHQIHSIEEALSAFPPSGALLIPNITPNVAGFPFSLKFYRYTTTKDGWDIALLIDERGVPIELYYARGKVNNEYAMVVPGDLLFSFYQNPLDPANESFDLDSLKMYIRYSVRTCINEIRQGLENKFRKAKSEKEKK